MSLEIDPARSVRARVDGNDSFRKGKWVEAIGHYTDSVVYNPRDAAAFCNRAAAYLKLEKYRDAERDCTTALEMTVGNVKALYRRTLARKGLGRLEEALRDIEEVLQLEHGNEAAVSELEELKGLKERARAQARAKKPRAVSPPRTGASMEEVPSDPSNVTQRAPVGSATPPFTDTIQPPGSTSFASLRKTRDAKKTFVTPATSDTPSHSPTSVSLESNPPYETTAPPPAPPAPSLALSAPRARPSQSTAGTSHPTTFPPSDPDAPGASLLLLCRLSPLSAQAAWAFLSSYPPSSIPRLIAPVLEPDVLGHILLALHHAIQQPASAHMDTVRTIMEGLQSTPRWRINVAMLSMSERSAGEGAWKACGGEGTWP